MLNCHLAAPIKLYFSPSRSCSVCLAYFNFLFRCQILEISVPILRLKRCLFFKELFQYLSKWYIQWHEQSRSVSLSSANAVQDWADFDLLRKASIAVIALGVINLVKTVDKGCQTLTSGHKSTRSCSKTMISWVIFVFLTEWAL